MFQCSQSLRLLGFLSGYFGYTGLDTKIVFVWMVNWTNLSNSRVDNDKW